MIKVAPSILSADFSRLGQEVSDICRDGADLVHVDVMDAHFVPNLTFGAMVLKAIKPYSTVPMDVHLMMTNPRDFIDQFISAGANRLTVHYELEDDVGEMLAQIRSLGTKAGICLKPQTPAKAIIPYLDLLDLVLVMTVEPGFGGQLFMEDMLPKITAVKQIIDNRPIDIGIDGGINDITAPAAVNAGGNVLIAGNYIFKAPDRQEAIKTLKGIAK